MTALVSGPGPSLGAAALLGSIFSVLIFLPTTNAAPVLEHQQHQVAEYYGETGCYYNFQHYEEGDRIITNEPCLNCTCHNRMLMCYLRVCPFSKAIGQDCTVEKKPEQCCPVITCPEVPVQLVTSSTTAATPPAPTSGSSAVGHPDNYGCTIDEVFYTDGAKVPGDPSKPCELCYCIRNRTACVMQECTLHVEGCQPVYADGVCCPVRYDCDYQESTEAALPETTVRPTPGLILTTTPGPLDCQHDHEVYADGAMLPNTNPCEFCYCMKGDIVCAVQECGTPLEREGKNCTALPPQPGSCCPQQYQCDNGSLPLDIMNQEKHPESQESSQPSDDSHPTTQATPVEPSVDDNEIDSPGGAIIEQVTSDKDSPAVPEKPETTDTDSEIPASQPVEEKVPEPTVVEQEHEQTVAQVDQSPEQEQSLVSDTEQENIPPSESSSPATIDHVKPAESDGVIHETTSKPEGSDGLIEQEGELKPEDNVTPVSPSNEKPQEQPESQTSVEGLDTTKPTHLVAEPVEAETSAPHAPQDITTLPPIDEHVPHDHTKPQPAPEEVPEAPTTSTEIGTQDESTGKPEEDKEPSETPITTPPQEQEESTQPPSLNTQAVESETSVPEVSQQETTVAPAQESQADLDDQTKPHSPSEDKDTAGETTDRPSHPAYPTILPIEQESSTNAPETTVPAVDSSSVAEQEHEIPLHPTETAPKEPETTEEPLHATSVPEIATNEPDTDAKPDSGETTPATAGETSAPEHIHPHEPIAQPTPSAPEPVESDDQEPSQGTTLAPEHGTEIPSETEAVVTGESEETASETPEQPEEHKPDSVVNAETTLAPEFSTQLPAQHEETHETEQKPSEIPEHATDLKPELPVEAEGSGEPDLPAHPDAESTTIPAYDISSHLPEAVESETESKPEVSVTGKPEEAIPADIETTVLPVHEEQPSITQKPDELPSSTDDSIPQGPSAVEAEDKPSVQDKEEDKPDYIPTSPSIASSTPEYPATIVTEVLPTASSPEESSPSPQKPEPNDNIIFPDMLEESTAVPAQKPESDDQVKPQQPSDTHPENIQPEASTSESPTETPDKQPSETPITTPPKEQESTQPPSLITQAVESETSLPEVSQQETTVAPAQESQSELDDQTKPHSPSEDKDTAGETTARPLHPAHPTILPIEQESSTNVPDTTVPAVDSSSVAEQEHEIPLHPTETAQKEPETTEEPLHATNVPEIATNEPDTDAKPDSGETTPATDGETSAPEYIHPHEPIAQPTPSTPEPVESDDQEPSQGTTVAPEHGTEIASEAGASVTGESELTPTETPDHSEEHKPQSPVETEESGEPEQTVSPVAESPDHQTSQLPEAVEAEPESKPEDGSIGKPEGEISGDTGTSERPDDEHEILGTGKPEVLPSESSSTDRPPYESTTVTSGHEAGSETSLVDESSSIPVEENIPITTDIIKPGDVSTDSPVEITTIPGQESQTTAGSSQEHISDHSPPTESEKPDIIQHVTEAVIAESPETTDHAHRPPATAAPETGTEGSVSEDQGTHEESTPSPSPVESDENEPVLATSTEGPSISDTVKPEYGSDTTELPSLPSTSPVEQKPEETHVPDEHPSSESSTGGQEESHDPSERPSTEPVVSETETPYQTGEQSTLSPDTLIGHEEEKEDSSQSITPVETPESHHPPLDQTSDTAEGVTESGIKVTEKVDDLTSSEIITGGGIAGVATLVPEQGPEGISPTDTTPAHGIVPGEGNCLVEGQSYQNNSAIPPMNPCVLSCRCVSSIVHCVKVTCSPPPAGHKNCIPVKDKSDACCNTYLCDGDSTPSLESDSHMAGGATTGDGKLPESTPESIDESATGVPVPGKPETSEESSSLAPEAVEAEGPDHPASVPDVSQGASESPSEGASEDKKPTESDDSDLTNITTPEPIESESPEYSSQHPDVHPVDVAPIGEEGASISQQPDKPDVTQEQEHPDVSGVQETLPDEPSAHPDQTQKPETNDIESGQQALETDESSKPEDQEHPEQSTGIESPATTERPDEQPSQPQETEHPVEIAPTGVPEIVQTVLPTQHPVLPVEAEISDTEDSEIPQTEQPVDIKHPAQPDNTQITETEITEQPSVTEQYVTAEYPSSPEDAGKPQELSTEKPSVTEQSTEQELPSHPEPEKPTSSENESGQTIPGESITSEPETGITERPVIVDSKPPQEAVEASESDKETSEHPEVSPGPIESEGDHIIGADHTEEIDHSTQLPGEDHEISKPSETDYQKPVPESVEPSEIEHTGTDQPETETEHAQTEQSRPEQSKPEEAQPVEHHPEEPLPPQTHTEQPETESQTDISQPDKLHTEQPQPVDVQPEEPQTNLPHTDQPQTEQTKPDETLPEQAKPGEPQPVEVQTEQSYTEQPETEQPGEIQPEQSQPELPLTEQPQTERPQTEQSQTDESHTAQPKPEDAYPEHSITEQSQPDEPQTEHSQPEEPQTEQSQPEEPQTEHYLPEEPQTEQSQPEELHPVQPKPEEPQPIEAETEQSHPESPYTEQPQTALPQEHEPETPQELHPDQGKPEYPTSGESQTEQSLPSTYVPTGTYPPYQEEAETPASAPEIKPAEDHTKPEGETSDPVGPPEASEAEGSTTLHYPEEDSATQQPQQSSPGMQVSTEDGLHIITSSPEGSGMPSGPVDGGSLTIDQDSNQSTSEPEQEGTTQLSPENVEHVDSVVASSTESGDIGHVPNEPHLTTTGQTEQESTTYPDIAGQSPLPQEPNAVETDVSSPSTDQPSHVPEKHPEVESQPSDQDGEGIQTTNEYSITTSSSQSENAHASESTLSSELPTPAPTFAESEKDEGTSKPAEMEPEGKPTVGSVEPIESEQPHGTETYPRPDVVTTHPSDETSVGVTDESDAAEAPHDKPTTTSKPQIELEGPHATEIPDKGEEPEMQTESVLDEKPTPGEPEPSLIDTEQPTSSSDSEKPSETDHAESEKPTPEQELETPHGTSAPALPSEDGSESEDHSETSTSLDHHGSTTTPAHSDQESGLPEPVVTDTDDMAVQQKPVDQDQTHEQSPDKSPGESGSTTEKDSSDGGIEHVTQVSHPIEHATIPGEGLDTSSKKPTDGHDSGSSTKPGVDQKPQHPSHPSPDYENFNTDDGWYPPSTDEDWSEGSFGPGTCRYGGKLYVSAQQIPRDDPCDFCFCFRSDIICLRQSCPPPIPDCHQEPIDGFCCPRYQCEVSTATMVNVSTTTTTTTTTLPPHFLTHAYQGAAIKTGCQLQGKSYKVGEKIQEKSTPCLECLCGGNGDMQCNPRDCQPEPMLRKMIMAAASRRR